MELNKYSKTLTQDPGQPVSQAQLYATGLSQEDMQKGQVGIVSTGFEGNPCNMHLNILARILRCILQGRTGSRSRRVDLSYNWRKRWYFQRDDGYEVFAGLP